MARPAMGKPLAGQNLKVIHRSAGRVKKKIKSKGTGKERLHNLDTLRISGP